MEFEYKTYSRQEIEEQKLDFSDALGVHDLTERAIVPENVVAGAIYRGYDPDRIEPGKVNVVYQVGETG